MKSQIFDGSFAALLFGLINQGVFHLPYGQTLGLPGMNTTVGRCIRQADECQACSGEGEPCLCVPWQTRGPKGDANHGVSLVWL